MTQGAPAIAPARARARTESRLATLISIAGFVAVSCAFASNMILARANAGVIPPFTLAFFRWLIIAAGLAPFLAAELRGRWRDVRGRGWLILATGFLGMFLCGATVYEAGETTNAINIGLIMTLSPIMVLIISWLAGLEKIGPFQVGGVVLAFAGALLIISRGDWATLWGVRATRGDLLVLVAMLGWSGYTLLQSRAAPGLGFIGRISLFAAVGAAMSLPFAVVEALAQPQRVFSAHAAAAYLFAGIVPGILAYGGFAALVRRFGSVRGSLAMYIGPLASALLSFAILGEPPDLVQIGAGALILGGVWASLRS